jgi:hypothetical protein
MRACASHREVTATLQVEGRIARAGFVQKKGVRDLVRLATMGTN